MRNFTVKMRRNEENNGKCANKGKYLAVSEILLQRTHETPLHSQKYLTKMKTAKKCKRTAKKTQNLKAAKKIQSNMVPILSLPGWSRADQGDLRGASK